MALSIAQLVRANEQKKARLAVEERAKFLYNEYIAFDGIKEFAKFFELSVREAIDEITLGRRLSERGL
jgi:hypothetical protein